MHNKTLGVHSSSTPAPTHFHQSAHQLEVCHSHGTLLIHLLLVFVLNQTLHQITRVDLVISHLLPGAEKRRRKTELIDNFLRNMLKLTKVINMLYLAEDALKEL